MHNLQHCVPRCAHYFVAHLHPQHSHFGYVYTHFGSCTIVYELICWNTPLKWKYTGLDLFFSDYYSSLLWFLNLYMFSVRGELPCWCQKTALAYWDKVGMPAANLHLHYTHLEFGGSNSEIKQELCPFLTLLANALFYLVIYLLIPVFIVVKY